MRWKIAYNSTAAFAATLAKAAQARIPYLQFVTWNDFGEGTMVAPTRRFRFSLLEQVQQFAGVPLDSTHLQSVLRLYTLRKQWKGNALVQKKLDHVFFLFVSLQIERARRMLDEIH